MESPLILEAKGEYEMRKISISEARELFFSSDAKYVSQEQASIYYDNFSGRLDVSTYITCGCLVVKSDSDWHIHALSKESDVVSAINEVKNNMGQSEKLMVLTWDNIPKELEEYRGAYKFARGYNPYTDDSIRPLTTDDCSEIERCCSPDVDDNQIGKNIAGEFLAYHKDMLSDPYIINLGLFKGNSLIGFVQAFKQKELDLSTINIFVNRAHRKNGYAKRLLSTICATSKDTIYCYSCVKTNTASINTAKACGFQFMGYYLFIC